MLNPFILEIAKDGKFSLTIHLRSGNSFHGDVVDYDDKSVIMKSTGFYTIADIAEINGFSGITESFYQRLQKTEEAASAFFL